MKTADHWQKVEEIFYAAIERDSALRQAFLDEVCGEDKELRSEVESLIAAHESPGEFIDTPAYKVTGALVEDASSQSRMGTLVGHYRIIGQVGRGGMGEVFLAEDSQLGRKAALKFLPAAIANNESSLRRFEQEARAASALNHPNIITIYEIGEAAGAHYIAAEMIEGETLRRRLSREKIPPAEAIEIAAQVASALTAAHQVGIIHRDIKPENIMLRPDGLVKVLDFGLAKLAEPTGQSSGSIQERVARVDTEPGLVMGTLTYMSPEQARGRDIDTRTDIFSLGVVLYEMIAQHQPFEGDTPSDVIASILKVTPPPLSRVAPTTPAELQRIVSRAIEKDKQNRYVSAEEMLADLKGLKQEMEFEAKLERTGGFMSSLIIRSTRVSPRYSALAIATALALIVAIVWLAVYFLSSRDELFSSPQVVQLTNWKSEPGEVTVSAAFSADGKFIAFSSIRGSHRNIWVKQTSGGDPVQITKSERDDSFPVWSPDGEQIAYVSKLKNNVGIYTIPILGGTPTLIKAFDSPLQVRLIRWSKDGSKLYYEALRNVFAFDLALRQESQVTRFDYSSSRAQGFSISPDGAYIAYSDTQQGQQDIWAVPMSGGAPVRLTNDPVQDRNPVWLPDSRRIIYSSDRNGVLQVCMASLDGRAMAQITSGDNDRAVADISSDGQKILFSSSTEEADIWGVNLTTGGEFAITSDVGVELWPNISPKGMIALQSVKNPGAGRRIFNGEIKSKSLAGGDEQDQTISNGFDPAWSPDGNLLAFLRSSGDKINLWAFSVTAGFEKRLTDTGIWVNQFTPLPYLRHQTNYSWSPDAARVAYGSSESGFSNLYVVSVNDANRAALSNNNDPRVIFIEPLWSPDGRRIAHLLRVGKPSASEKEWSVGVYEGSVSKIVFQSESALRLMGWTEDGKSLIVSKTDEQSSNLASPTEVALFEVAVDGSGSRQMMGLKSAYFNNIFLSPDRKYFAFTSRLDGRDNIWIAAREGGNPRKITSNNDPRVFFSNLTWSPDSKTIYYARQTKLNVISMLVNSN
ncbi:MAG: protein kinase [Acidobacteriota bacterium]